MKPSKLISYTYQVLISIWTLIMLSVFIAWRVTYNANLPDNVSDSSTFVVLTDFISQRIGDLSIMFGIYIGGLIMAKIASGLTFRVVDSILKRYIDNDKEV